uniref:AAA+ ATPase domain-containing protein n=1 Tax=viral metagenome TaxID=1070528 RepID=A0A6C0KZE8_9ZZZZ
MDSALLDPNTPRKVGDIVGNTDMWTSLEQKIVNKSCPHLVICGPSGVGKTTFVRCALLNKGYCVLTHNCIADSGLRDVRDAIRSFARGGIDGRGNHRWIILEHADSLTADTQAFLRRLLETASGSTRFIFEVRESGALSEPILSRSLLCTVDSPSVLEIRYELLRRTNHTVSMEDAERIAIESCGNVRIAIHQALVVWKAHVGGYKVGIGIDTINDIWSKKPDDTTSDEYGKWACESIQTLRKQGADPRIFLRSKMASNSLALRVLSQWNRPGGASSRSLWLHAVCGETS